MKDWIKSGEITSDAREFGKKLIKVGKSHLNVTEEIEAKIRELGGKPAFPVQISVNEVAAHFNPLVGKDFKFKEGDICKLDLGVSVNGALGDTAVTIDLGNNTKLVKSSEKALKAALEIIRPGIKIREIGKLIEDTILSEGFQPIRNLGGHGLKEFEVHTSPNIPNFDSGNNTKLKENQVVAIEPFASNGEGFVVNGVKSEIYELVGYKNVRNQNARKILNFINEEFNTLPFSKRDLLKEFENNVVVFGLNDLLRNEILKEFSVLVEKNRNSLVSQAEHTIIVGKQVTTL